MKLSLVIDHLKASVADLHERIEGATSLAAIGETGAIQGQKGFVVPLQERAARNSLSANAVRQRVTDQIGVVVAVRNVRDLRGEAAHDGGLDTIRGQVMTAMIGWVPATGYNHFEYAGGALLKIKDGTVYWLFRFETSHHETNI
jgi:hypothetical protein